MIPGIVAAQASGIVPVWSPENLASPPALWVNDLSAMTLASSAISQWNDRSANNWHLTQATSANQPLAVAAALNGRRIVRFDGSNDKLAIPSAGLNLFNAVSSGWIGLVAKKTGSDGSPTSRRVLVFTNNSTAARFGVYWDDSTAGAANRIVVGARRTDAGAYNRVQSAATSNDVWVMILAFVDYSARTLTLYTDGAMNSQITSAFDAAGVTSATSSASASIGDAVGGAAAFAGDIAEAMCGVGLPTTTEIDKLFGYMAHRWALTGNLPSGHPYKTVSP